MTEPRVWTFFYGSYMNFEVLREVDLVPEEHAVARLDGFDIRIAPRANLVRSDACCVWGILATATHAELKRLYAHAKDVLGETYLPEAVLARTRAGDYRPALCYICPVMEPRSADADYVARIVAAARQFNFPSWYVERLASFAV
jgi:hypothetical protein